MAIIAMRSGPRAEAAGTGAGACRDAAAPAARRPRRRRRPAPAPQVQKITLASKALFDFDKAVLKPEGMAAIDSEIIAKLKDVQKLELVLVTGHTDRIGSQAYNQKLSERRADAVRDYLVSQGCREGQDRDPRHGQDAAGPGRDLHDEGDEGTDRLPRAEPPRGSRSQGRGGQAVTLATSRKKPRLRAGLFFSCPAPIGYARVATLPSVASHADCRPSPGRRLDRADRARRRARGPRADRRRRTHRRARPRSGGGRALRGARAAGAAAPRAAARASSTRTRTRR